MVLGATSGVVNTYFVSRLGADAIAALSLVFPVNLIVLTMMGGGVGAGVSAAVAQALGGGRRARRRASRRARVRAHGGPLGGAHAGLRRRRADPVSLDGRDGRRPRRRRSSSRAFSSAACSSPSPCRPSTAFCAARATYEWRRSGQPSRSRCRSCSCRCSCFHSASGSAGAAAATIIWAARRFAAARVLRVRRTRHRATQPLSPPLSARPIRDILRVGVPASLATLANYLGLLLLTAIVARYGTHEIAAFGLGTRLDFLILTLAFGVGSAVLTLVGIGRRRRRSSSRGGARSRAARARRRHAVTVVGPADLEAGALARDLHPRAGDLGDRRNLPADPRAELSLSRHVDGLLVHVPGSRTGRVSAGTGRGPHRDRGHRGRLLWRRSARRYGRSSSPWRRATSPRA